MGYVLWLFQLERRSTLEKRGQSIEVLLTEHFSARVQKRFVSFAAEFIGSVRKKKKEIPPEGDLEELAQCNYTNLEARNII